MKKDYAYCQIAFKILLRKGNKVLFLIYAEKGYLDLPGGRADEDEKYNSLEKILNREVREELGGKVKYHLGLPIFQNRRYYEENKYVLITVYEAEYVSGPIKLSFEHKGYKWLDPQKYKFKEKEFFNREEYKVFRKYFKRQK